MYINFGVIVLVKGVIKIVPGVNGFWPRPGKMIHTNLIFAFQMILFYCI